MQSACTCIGGIDCFVYDETGDPLLVGTPYAGCMFQASEYQMQQQGVTWPTNSPTDPNGNPTGYTTMEECCNATECCRAVCETDPAPSTVYELYSSYIFRDLHYKVVVGVQNHVIGYHK